MQVIGRFHIPLDPEENQKLNSCPILRNSPRKLARAHERPRWECRPPTLAFVLHDRCSPVSGWVAWALSPQSGCGEVPCLPSPSCSPICWQALVTSGNSFLLLSCVLFVGSSWSHPWGRMGVGGGWRQLGFFSWWVVGLELSQASQPSLPQPPPPLVHDWDISSSSDLIRSQHDDCLLLCKATGSRWSQI